MRLVDKSEVEELMKCYGFHAPDMTITEFIEDELTTISAVPVVRCRECKKWDADPDSYGKDDGPKGKCMKSFEKTYDDDFCSYGQRKEADHDQN